MAVRWRPALQAAATALGCLVACLWVAPEILAQLPLPQRPLAYVRVVGAQMPGGVRDLATILGEGAGAAVALAFDDRVEIGWISSGGSFDGVRRIPMDAGAARVRSGDLDGDGRADLVVGVGRAGSLMWVRSVMSSPIVMRADGYLFGTARDVLTAELDGRPPQELVALNEQGALFIFTAALGGGYRRVWSSPPGWNVLAVAAGDLDGDGMDELAAGSGEGAVSVMRWDGARLTPVASSFPWGEPTALAVARPPPDAGGGRPLLVVATSRSLLYVYALEAGQLVLDRQAGAEGLYLDWMRADQGSAEPDGAPLVLVEGAGPSGIQLYRLSGRGLARLAEVAWPGPHVRFVRVRSGMLVMARPDGSVEVLEPVGADYLQMALDGAQVKPRRLRWAGDLPLVPLDELARLTGVRYAWRPGERQAVIADGDGRVVAQDRRFAADGNRASVLLPVAPRLEGQDLHVPFDVLRALGWGVHHEPPYRRLEVRSPWPTGL